MAVQNILAQRNQEREDWIRKTDSAVSRLVELFSEFRLQNFDCYPRIRYILTHPTLVDFFKLQKNNKSKRNSEGGV